MSRALLYTQYDDTQRSIAISVLEKYSQLVQWNIEGGDVIMDVGCGPGDVTKDILLPNFPENFRKLIGIDISEEMITFSEKLCVHPKTSFQQMDITKTVPLNFQESFDHIFSFCCLHWVEDQRQAFSNILKMLKPGKDTLLTFAAQHPFFEVYEVLSKHKLFEYYMQDVEKNMSPYQKSNNPAGEIAEVLREVGFCVKICTLEKMSWVYPNVETIKAFIASIDPFYRRLPIKSKSLYLEEFVNEMRKLQLTTWSNNVEHFDTSYILFVIYATKPI